MRDFFDNFYDWWKNIDKFIFLTILFLFVLGLFFSLVSTSLIASDKLDTNSYYFFFKHFVFIVLAISTLSIISFLNQNLLVRFSIFFFLISLLTLILVPFIGIEVKGSKRWIEFAFFPRFQPIEILKPFLIIFLSSILSLEKKNLYLKYFLSIIIIIPISLLLISQPDLGQTLLIISIWLVLIFVSGINLYFFFPSSYL